MPVPARGIILLILPLQILTLLIPALLSFILRSFSLSCFSGKRDASGMDSTINERACQVMQSVGRGSVVIKGDAVICSPNRTSYTHPAAPKK